jgi:hypothetical protein
MSNQYVRGLDSGTRRAYSVLTVGDWPRHDEEKIMDTSNAIFANTIKSALAMLRPQQRYAAEVLTGQRLWSGADLKGKAKKYGASYALQRRAAKDALRKAGGEVIEVEHGRKVAAVLLRADADGGCVYATAAGLYRLAAGERRAEPA